MKTKRGGSVDNLHSSHLGLTGAPCRRLAGRQAVSVPRAIPYTRFSSRDEPSLFLTHELTETLQWISPPCNKRTAQASKRPVPEC